MNQYIFEPKKPVIETKYGKLRGVTYGDVNIFMGVQYATARRFHQPEEPEKWEGVKDAFLHGPVAPLMAQVRFPFSVSAIGKHRVLTLDSVSMGIPAELRAALHLTAGFMSVKRVPSISLVSFFSLSRRAL